MTVAIPRESLEFLPVGVTRNGAPIVSGVTFAVVASSARPTVFVAAVTDGEDIGVQLGTYPPGLYEVWAKVTVATGAPVFSCGPLRIT